MPGYKDDARLNKGRLAGKLIGSVMAGVALVGCSTNPEAKPVETTSQLPPTPDKPSASPSASETPSAGETSSSAEFTPGATGKYSPEALAEIADDPEALAKVFQITGDTPEEIATNAQKALIGFLMSGTTETDLAPYRVNGFVNIPDTMKYKNDMRDKYSGPACRGMNGRVCSFTQPVENLHDTIVTIHALNHSNSADSAGLPPDFMLGVNTVSDVKVLKGSIDSGILTIQYDLHTTDNYSGSAAEEIVNNLKENDQQEAAAKYSAVLEWGGLHRMTETYQRAGNHWNVVDSSGT